MSRVNLSSPHLVLTVLLLMLASSTFVSISTVKGQVLSIDVRFVSSPPAYVNQTFEITATVSGGTPTYTYQWYTKWFPPWKAGMDPEQYRASAGNEIAVPGATSATFMFTPQVEGIYWIGVGVSDSAGNSVSRFPSIQPLQLIVNNPTPQTTSPSPTPSPIPTQSLTPSPSIPELPWLAIVPLLFSIFAVAAAVRYRKVANQSRKFDRA
jgi:hypothetical protein